MLKKKTNIKIFNNNNDNDINFLEKNCNKIMKEY